MSRPPCQDRAMASDAKRPSLPAEAVTYVTVSEAVSALRSSGVVAIPTDTVYGLAASAFDERAIARVYEIKGRDFDVALPVLLADAEDMERCAVSIPDLARGLAGRFWPGPLTIVVPKSNSMPDVLTAGMSTVGLRVPHHPVPRELSRLLGSPLTGTSANRSGMPSMRSASAVILELGSLLDGVVDGGDLLEAEPSTVVDVMVDPPRILRSGAVSAEELADAAGIEFSTA
ncbi:MAG: threonylcarbamoyl-AMP synthase [SAR202 cluster bacterium]|nr:threonylcarbamoyl-AMP synthase [Chloroflexota bacterium]MQG57686.1 threonylcarbamoyl-AMP synthase [SAR202 cluster bacterium]MQG69850.1 threonylcarbamoyl-AMP synthase [SAR202 cluster bacterium]